VPLVSCPQCRIRQYAQVSYVMTVRCVACGYSLNLVASQLRGQPPHEGSARLLEVLGARRLPPR
jgi:Zn ribbon nucleic-acid-binding protein